MYLGVPDNSSKQKKYRFSCFKFETYILLLEGFFIQI